MSHEQIGFLPDDGSVTVPVVVIGNGPSGICLSYLLSGYRPYLSEGAPPHPNHILQIKLEENLHTSILEQDLEYLCEGLEGRSANPVALLLDSLLHPDADCGADLPSPIRWEPEPHRAIPHVVLGKGAPGGAWNAMDTSMQTLSLGNWMELPDLPFKDWIREQRRHLRNDRATTADVARYYRHYVKCKGLQQSFVSGVIVTSVHRLRDPELIRPSSPSSPSASPLHPSSASSANGVAGIGPARWEVRGHHLAVSGGGEGRLRRFRLRAAAVVLATGGTDSPARLGVPGEGLPFVQHAPAALERAVARGEVGRDSEPLLVVGAGLTAADAVLAARHHAAPVQHAFRRAVTDPALIFNQLPKMLYPEYHKVHHMMGESDTSYNGYASLPRHRVLEFRPDRKVLLQGPAGELRVLPVSMALVLIGSNPDLSFLACAGRSLAMDPSRAVSCRHNPLDVHPFTYECERAPRRVDGWARGGDNGDGGGGGYGDGGGDGEDGGEDGAQGVGCGLFAVGPLVGDNFVRFCLGGALGVVGCLEKRWLRR
uniref:Oxidative stress-induced growth inhibitor 1-like n=1 Tax=Petromyzon marinus TaxID=7757 RepID=A0AAJ7TAW9_PETMA|nr:oxidative stress-induced growth inhibitor 1-like [Petromyzon marinus]XP_032813526.1 oxidative stress-induced growth inhibitor 1-like [Petromyzon marinus]